MQRQGLLWNMRVESATDRPVGQRSTSTRTRTNKCLSGGDVKYGRILKYSIERALSSDVFEVRMRRGGDASRGNEREETSASKHES